MIRVDYLFKIFIVTFSLTFGQIFNPETGQKIEPTFDSNTGIFLKSDSSQNIYVPLISNISFDRNYFQRTIYRKDGFGGPYYIEYGKKISTRSLLGRFDTYDASNEVNRQIRRNKNLSLLGGILILTSPFSGLVLDWPSLSVIQFYGGTFFLIKGSINVANLLHKGIWIFNRETVKEYFQHKIKK